MASEVNPTLIIAAVNFLKEFAGVAAPADTAKYISHENQQVLEFTLPEEHDTEATRRELNARLGVPEDTWNDQHGAQHTWDLEPDRKRVTLTQRYGEAPQIGLVHWD